jgi:hypothetical protein
MLGKMPEDIFPKTMEMIFSCYVNLVGVKFVHPESLDHTFTLPTGISVFRFPTVHLQLL